MGSAATFEGAISDPLDVPSGDQVGMDDAIKVDQLADGQPDELTDSIPEETDEFAGLTPAEIRAKVAEEVKAEAEKDFEARKAQALKDQARALADDRRREAEMARLVQERQLASQEGINATAQALAQLYRQAADSDEGFRPEMVNDIAGRLYTGVKRAHFEREVVAPTLERLRPYGIQVDPEFQQYFTQGVARQDPAMVQYAAFESLRKATYAEAWAAFQKAGEADRATEAKAAEEAKALQAERKRATGSVQPTNARGAASRNEYERILNTAKPGSPEWERAYEAKFGFKSS